MTDHQLPDDLEPIAARLRANRAQADPLLLDQIKRTVMTRASRSRGSDFMRSRFATWFTLVALLGGTGGAVAIGATGSSGGPQGGAACGQYNPGHQTNGQPCKRKRCKNRKHAKNNKCKTNKKPAKPKKSKGKKNGTSVSKCTLRTQHGVTVLYCP